MEGNEAIIAEPSTLVTEVQLVLADETVDPSAIPAPLVEDVVEKVLVPVTNAGTQDVQSNLPATYAEEVVDESPNHDFQQVMEGEDETGKVLLISPIRNLVSEDPSSIEVVPVEGISPSLSLFSSSFF